MRVKDELHSLSVRMCSLDNSLFMWFQNGELEGLICIYVDDFLWAGTDLFYASVVKVLRTKFLIGSSASASFTYVGLCIKSYVDGITVDQSRYISSLNPVPLSKARTAQTCRLSR